jgi:heme/copper-type cytochrome/quinol oxidase subunit 2
MHTAEHHWLAVVLIVWASVFLIVLGAMLGSIVNHRAAAHTVPPACRASIVAEAAWALTAIAMVILMVLLTIR